MKPVNKLRNEKLAEEELDTKRSTALSIWFIIIPFYLIFCAVMKMTFNLHLHLFDVFDEFYKSFNNGLLGKIVAPSIMLGLPAIAIIINMLSILEMYYDRSTRELRIRLKNKPLNFLILLLAILVLGLFVVYWFTKV
ncbi:MAG: hypothetical protein NTX65_08530 [Ignavibacteriales bacterium]|nr:hypothetical protein [Ignavibacteriales bacterium]